MTEASFCILIFIMESATRTVSSSVFPTGTSTILVDLGVGAESWILSSVGGQSELGNKREGGWFEVGGWAALSFGVGEWGRSEFWGWVGGPSLATVGEGSAGFWVRIQGAGSNALHISPPIPLSSDIAIDNGASS
ncbi:hypothetical protein TIFTF001_042307 [Ficus carica]|uniref:Uncharacterized protein n=1 Tax=Ficus carica TaxID=3494 RepID=A0AA88DEV1_FICCA|nr:hypothetical protein TIFTF001_042307 [Ficus carica]